MSLVIRSEGYLHDLILYWRWNTWVKERFAHCFRDESAFKQRGTH